MLGSKSRKRSGGGGGGDNGGDSGDGGGGGGSGGTTNGNEASVPSSRTRVVTSRHKQLCESRVKPHASVSSGRLEPNECTVLLPVAAENEALPDLYGLGGIQKADGDETLDLDALSDDDLASLSPRSITSVTSSVSSTRSPGRLSAMAAKRRPYLPRRGDLMATRLRYYQRLSPSGEFCAPTHVVPEELLLRGAISGKNHMHGSLTTIFSIWNTMMGSSLLALPWGFMQSGLGLGFGLLVCIGLIGFYTANLIVVHGRGMDDFFDLCNLYLGRAGKLLCWSSSLFLLLGALMAYQVLMTDSLFMSVNGIYKFATGRHVSDEGSTLGALWSLDYVPIYIVIAVFPLCNLRSFSMLVKMNTFGIVCPAYIVLYVVSYCIFDQGLLSQFTGWGECDSIITHHGHDVEGHTSVLPEVPLASPHFPKLAGLLSLSMFIHNMILPIMKHQKNPEHNTRDLAIAYLLVGISYGVFGAIGYLAFNNMVTEDFLYVFSTTSIGAIIARLSLLFQLSAVFPLLLTIMRIQFFGLLWKSQYPSLLHVVVFNVIVTTITTLVSIFYPHIGDILGFTGAFGGFIYIYLLPIGVHLAKQYKKNKGDLSAMLGSIVFHSALICVGMALIAGQFVTIA